MFGLLKTLPILILSVQLLTALPLPHLTIYDTRSERYHVYRRDGSLYGRYDSKEEFNRGVTNYEELAARGAVTVNGTQCSALKLDQAKTLPGWDKIVQFADDHYGGGSYNLVVNPPEYMDRGATVCIDSEVTQIQLSGGPTCTEQNTIADGVISGTNGSVQIQQTQGFTNEAQWTVTQSTSIGASVTFSATLGVPEVESVTASATASVDITNEVGSSFTSSANTQSTSQVTYDAPDGNTCSATLTTKTCNASGKGSVRLVADGWVWFNYDDKRAAKDDPSGGEHFKWAVNIASAIPNKDDRSSSLDFVGSMQTTSHTNYKANCVEASSSKAKAAAKTAILSKRSVPVVSKKPAAQENKSTPATKIKLTPATSGKTPARQTPRKQGVKKPLSRTSPRPAAGLKKPTSSQNKAPTTALKRLQKVRAGVPHAQTAHKKPAQNSIHKLSTAANEKPQSATQKKLTPASKNTAAFGS